MSTSQQLTEHGRAALEGLLRDATVELRNLYHIIGVEPGATDAATGVSRAVELGNTATELAAVLQQWFFDGRYLDDDGSPRRIPLEGELSLTTLVRSTGVQQKPLDIALQLLANGLIDIDRQQRFRPTTRVVGGSYEIRAQNAIRGVVCALRTAVRNLADIPKNDRWFHRTATVTIPANHVAELEAFVRDQGSAILFSIDDWCSQRTPKSAPPESLTTVDINIYFTPVSDKSTSQSVAQPQTSDDRTPNVVAFLPTPRR